MKKRAAYIGAGLLVGGGGLAMGAVWYASRKNQAMVETIREAVQDTGGFGGGGAGGSWSPGDKGVIDVRLTGYWPFTARDDEKKMEGGVNDRKGNRLHTLEQHLADSVAHPYVSVSGDDAVFPYGQRVEISAWPKAVFRVVDTGGHFRGAGKIYRALGREPLDICVDSDKTPVPKTSTTARIVAGDNFERGKAVAAAGIKNQNVVFSGVDAALNRDALARAIESELGGRPVDEQHAAAWVLRNRAAAEGKSVTELLAPRGEYGAPQKSGGFASTRRPATPRAIDVADAVLGSDDEHDPTNGATDFWVPQQQARMRSLGDVHRAARASGDADLAQKYARFAGFAHEDDVRAGHARKGLKTTKTVGVLELLRKA
jgi:hypothetical protein